MDKHGGKREGAGRKPAKGESRRLRLRLSEEQWRQIDEMNLDISELVSSALESRDKIQEEAANNTFQKQEDSAKIEQLKNQVAALEQSNKKYLGHIEFWKEQTEKVKKAQKTAVESVESIGKLNDRYIQQIEDLERKLRQKPRGNTKKQLVIITSLFARKNHLESEIRAHSYTRFKEKLDTTHDPNGVLRYANHYDDRIKQHKQEIIFIQSLISTLNLKPYKSDYSSIAEDRTFQKVNIQGQQEKG